jgi:hypothetical protein
MIRYWRTIAVSLAAALSVLLVGIVRAEPPDSALKSGTADCARPDFRVVLTSATPRNHPAPKAHAEPTNLISICGSPRKSIRLSSKPALPRRCLW